MSNKPNRTRDTLINVRTMSETKEGLKELAVLMSDELGTKVTQVQVLEMLINDALRVRKPKLVET